MDLKQYFKSLVGNEGLKLCMGVRVPNPGLGQGSAVTACALVNWAECFQTHPGAWCYQNKAKGPWLNEVSSMHLSLVEGSAYQTWLSVSILDVQVLKGWSATKVMTVLLQALKGICEKPVWWTHDAKIKRTELKPKIMIWPGSKREAGSLSNPKATKFLLFR